MASIAYDHSEAPDRPPLSAHPAFPAIIALWFAVLLGLGSLAVPVVLLERVVTATGVASLVPAAGPPLGMTARGLLALVAALAGAGLGTVLGRRVEATQRPAGETRRAPRGEARRAPLSIKDELGSEGLVNGESLPITRRRALAISTDDRPGDYHYDGPFATESEDTIEAFDEDESDAPLELSTPADDTAAFPPGFADEPVADEDYEMTDVPDFQPEPEPLAFSAPSFARHASEPHNESDEARPAPIAAVESASEPADESEWVRAPLEELGLVQLVQRLGSTIERRRDRLAESTAAPVASDPAAPARIAPAAFEVAPADEAAQAMAAYFGGEAAPDASQPGALDDECEEGEDAGAGYSSLLGISHPFARLDDDFEPLEGDEPGDERRFDPPAEETAPHDTDAALRAALATLQRMSGAA